MLASCSQISEAPVERRVEGVEIRVGRARTLRAAMHDLHADHHEREVSAERGEDAVECSAGQDFQKFRVAWHVFICFVDSQNSAVGECGSCLALITI